MSLGVTVDFNAHLGNITGQIDNINGQLQGFQARAETMSSRVNKAFGAIGVGLSVAGIAAFVKSGIDAADALNDMADRTGITVEKLAGFQLATKLADTDMEAFAASVNKLSVNIGKSGDDFKKLGIDAKDPAEAFLQLADVMRGIDDPQQRAALGAKALGKSWAEMAPLLLQGGDALREQIDKGQKMSAVTTEQAKAAAELNDRIDELGKNLTTLNSRVVGPLIPILSATAAHFAYAAKEAQGFSDVFTADFWARVRGGSDVGMDIEKIKAIDSEISAQKGKIQRINDHPILAGLENYSAEEEINKLADLVDRRGNLVKQISIQNAAALPNPVADAPKPSAKTIADFVGGGDGDTKKGQLSDEQKAVNKLANEYDNLLATMQKEVALRGDNSNAAKMEYDVINGSLSGLNDNQKIKLLNLAAEKDQIELNTKAYEEYDQIIADGIELAKKQQSAMAGENSRLERKFDAPRLDLNAGISDAMDARAVGIIPDDVALKKVLDKMGRDYNDLTDDAKNATTQMSEFAVQAAHNMQNAFADFLFDPFKDGAEGMAVSFLTTIKRMAADAAAANIMEGLFGAPGKNGQQSLTGGLVGGVAKGAGEWISGLFSGYASGGDHPGGLRIVGERGPELEATGPSRIYNAKQTKDMLSGGNPGHTVNISINMAGGNAPDKKSASNLAYQIGAETKRALARNG